MRKLTWKVVTLFTISLSLAWSFAGNGALAADRITSDVSVSSGKSLTPKERRALSYAAIRILKHVHQARVDIRYEDEKDALRHTEKALKLVNIVETALPSYKVATNIKSGDLTYEDEESVKPTLIPIYMELDEVTSLLLPVRRAKLEAADSQSGGTTSVQYTNVMLDVNEAKYQLEQAAALLKKKDTAQANTALKAIQEGVIFEYDEIDVPLLKARWNLIDASRSYARKDYEAAKRSLERAASALEIYKTRVGSQISRRAQALADEIKALADKLGEKTEGAADKITGLWDKLINQF